ncbi:1629_t:CDS:2, partial [Rhizophagus irregularis]
ELLPVKENLRLFERPPKGLSEKLPDEENLGPVKENPGFEKFEEGLLDNKNLHKILQFIYKLPTCSPIRDKRFSSEMNCTDKSL